MIKFSGTFYENEYFKYIYSMDDKQPINMSKTAAVVLCIDAQRKPLFRSLSALEIENFTEEEVEEHLARYKDIDPKNPAPLPLPFFST